MAIHDSDPERRNLVATSLAFLIYYLADGRLSSNGSITLQVVPVTFQNTLALVIIAWLMLLWFALRYWQTHRESYFMERVAHTRKFSSNSHVIDRYLAKGEGLNKFEKGDGTFQNGYRDARLFFEKDNLYIQYAHVDKFVQLSPGNVSVTNERKPIQNPVKGKQGVILKARLFFAFAIETHGYTSFAVPYILFYSVLVVAVMQQYGWLN